MKKKKPKGAEDGKDAKDDEQGLVDGEQVEAEEVKKYFFKSYNTLFWLLFWKLFLLLKTFVPAFLRILIWWELNSDFNLFSTMLVFCLSVNKKNKHLNMKSENTFLQLKILVGHPRDEKCKITISTHP